MSPKALPTAEEPTMAMTLAHSIAIVLFAVGGVINLVLGAALLGRSIPLALGFLVVSVVLFVGLLRSDRLLVTLGAAGLVAGPMVAQVIGAETAEMSLLSLLLGVLVLLAVWWLTLAHRPWNRPRPADD